MYLYGKAFCSKSIICKSVLIMEWLPIAAFIVIGIVLIIVEIIFVPGTTIVGIAGFLSMGYGIYLSYVNFGSTAGTSTLIASVVASGLFIYYSFRNRSWERFSLKTTMDNRVNQEHMIKLDIGEKGVSISSLKPVGKAIISNQEIEVRSNGGFIEENVEIEVHRIEGNKIFVKPVNK